MTNSDQSTDPEHDRRQQLIAMVREIQNASACVMDFDGMLSRLEEKAGSRRIGQLIFEPPGGKSLTAEQIVDALLNEPPKSTD